MSEGLEVLEAGRALKVQTDTPHLVSLGGGRLSTAVTLNPLPQGRVSLGSAREADIVLQGAGVEPLHCHIENSNGVVTLYPLAEMTSVDGLKVTAPTRLTQGCMLCVGRSNHLRFNHPAEARLMKSVYQGRPPVAPRRSPRDSWGEVSTGSSGAEDFSPRRSQSTMSLSGRLATPSPAFNRNPSAFRSVTPSLGEPGMCSSMEELGARSSELEHKRKQAQEARVREQEVEMQERARLEEILNMCAEYERQVQCERQQNKPPPTPTLHQNRIKTNGSLPRDKRLASPTSPAPDDEMSEIFTFETSTTSVVGSFSLSYSEKAAVRSPYENVIIPAPPQSPRTRIRTIAPSVKDMSEVIENRMVVAGENKFILPLEPEEQVDAMVIPNQLAVNGDAEEKQKVMGEVEQLRRERGKLLATMSGLKRKVAEIELQEEELLRELDMERALLEGEWQAQSDKLMQEEDRLSVLRERVAGLDEEMEHCRNRQAQRQDEAKWRLEIREKELASLEQEVATTGSPERRRDLAEKLHLQQELLEAERKAFEDLEFSQLEEEAGWLAGREELQRELVDMAARVEVRSLRLQELERQRLEAAQSTQEESRALERQLLSYLRRLEEGRNRQRSLEAQLAELTCEQASSPDGSSDADEVDASRKVSSQDDLDRISRVTSGAPIEMSSGSLGRRALESLQEIERNRQRHLVQQGSQVIEEERKRVQELKRRVQDEVRAQWEERRQREANCNSLNSVGSEDSSVTSSDVPTESASSDDALLSPTNTPKTECAENGNTGKKNDTESSSAATNQTKMREKELQMEETRPLSDGSAYEQHLSAPIRKRDKASPGPQQRPLTRYLPIRSESLNLRQHIETAGHQIELCGYVTLDSTSCRGYLHKMGSKFHHWNKRWFVFDRVRRTLTYYCDRGEKKPRGGAYFQAIEEVYVDHLNSVKSPNPQLTFVVKTNERMYHLMAPSPEAMRIWVDVIFTGAEGYQEFEHGS